jgi:hypothetical protein
MGADCDYCEKNPAYGRYIVILGGDLPDVTLCDKCGMAYHPTLVELREHFAAKPERRPTLAEPVSHSPGKWSEATAIIDAGPAPVSPDAPTSPQASAHPSPSPALTEAGEGAAGGTIIAEVAPRRLSRTGGPETSLEAARLAAKASKKAMQQVRRVMADGLPRIDEELWQACRDSGYVTSLATVQHGRLALSEAGILEDTGKTRTTSNGCKSRIWKMKLQAELPL